MNATDRTPADLLSSALAADPARPLVTFYDDATGERVELSVATFANWVAKTANYLQGELAAGPGDRLALLLPAHWQTAVWLLACSSVGVVAEVEGDPAAADLVVAGPDRLEAARACSGERVALALRPLGGRFPQPPAGFADFAVEAPGQGDRFAPFAPVDPADAALVVGGEELTGAGIGARALADAAAAGMPQAPGCCRGCRTTPGRACRTGSTPRWRPAVPWCCAATRTGWTRTPRTPGRPARRSRTRRRHRTEPTAPSPHRTRGAVAAPSGPPPSGGPVAPVAGRFARFGPGS